MDRRFLTVLLGSLILAFVVSTVFYQITARASGAGSGRTKEPSRDLVVAARPLSIGIPVAALDLRVQQVPASAFPKGGFGKLEDVIGRPVISNVLEGEPILEGRLAARGSGLGLAAVIPVGMRAVTVRVNDVTAVAGFVLPGMRVDVLVTGRPPGSNGTYTTTCLQDILVLSAGQTMQADGKGQTIQAPSVTLLATPRDAEYLALANQDGHVQLVLRNGGDRGIEKPPGVKTAQLFGIKGGPDDSGAPVRPVAVRRPVQRTAAAEPRPSPQHAEVVVLRGNKRTVEPVPDGSR